MGLFSKPNIPSIDIAALQRRAEETAAKRRNIIQGLTQSLGALNPQYEQKIGALGNQLVPQTEQRLEQLGREAGTLAPMERESAKASNRAFREQAFRAVPEQQRAIREALGGAGLLQSGAAASTIARPTIDALRASRDFSTGQEANLIEREANRNAALVETRANERAKALETKFGLDKDTIKYLQNIGREDLIKEAEALSGIEGDLGSALLQADILGQEQAIKKAEASAARRGAIFGSLGSLAGLGVGALVPGASPLTVALGSQIGGQLGGVASGANPQQIDPTLLFALMQQRRNNIINSFNPSPAGKLSLLPSSGYGA